MTTTVNPIGQKRQSLASQIDRLDSVLDDLADGIQKTVVEAVKASVGCAVREAVQAALTEVLTNAEWQQRLRPVPVAADLPMAPVVQPVLQRLGGWLVGTVKGVWSRIATLARLAQSKVIGVMSQARNTTVEVV